MDKKIFLKMLKRIFENNYNIFWGCLPFEGATTLSIMALSIITLNIIYVLIYDTQHTRQSA